MQLSTLDAVHKSYCETTTHSDGVRATWRFLTHDRYSYYWTCQRLNQAGRRGTLLLLVFSC